MKFKFLNRLRFSKKAALLCAALLFCSKLFCEDYVITWNGSVDDDYTNEANWDYEGDWGPPDDGSVVVIIPKTESGIYPVFTGNPSLPAKSFSIAADARLTINDDCGFIVSDASVVNGTLINKGTITLGATLTVNGTLNNESGANITTDTSCTVIVNGAFTDEGDFSSDLNLSFEGTENSSFIPNSSTSYSLISVAKTSGTLTFDGELTSDVINVTGCDTIIFNGATDVTAFSCISNSAVITFNNEIHSTDFSSVGNSSSIVFKGDSNFTDLELSGEGSVYKFAAETVCSVNGVFKALGNDSGSVTLTTNHSFPSVSNQSSWFSLNLSNEPSGADFNYVKISYCQSVSDLRGCEWASDVIESVSNSTRNFFPYVFYWIGKTNNSWTEKSNWSCEADSEVEPGNAPSVSDTRLTIILKQVTSGRYNLLLAQDISVKQLTVETGGEVNFSSYNVSTVNGLLNDGTVILGGNQTISGSVTNDDNSLVEYTGFCSSLPMTTNYNDLKFSDGATSFDTSDNPLASLTVAGDLFINNGALNVLTLSGSNKLHGLVAVGNINKAGIITIDARGLSTGVSFWQDVDCSSLYVTGNVYLNGNVTVRAETNAVEDGIISFTYGNVIIKDNILISAQDNSGNLSSVIIASLQNYDDDAHSLTVNANFTCSDSIGSSNLLDSLTVNGSFNFSGAAVTTVNNQTYKNGINYTRNGALSLTTSSADLEFTGDIVSSNSTGLNIIDSNFEQTASAQLSGFSSINIVQNYEDDLSADFSNITVASSPSWNFTGSADNQLEINFGSSEIKNVTVNKEGSLKIIGSFEQNSIAALSITKGNVLAGNGVFKAGIMTVGTSGTFVQSGNNNTNEQSFSSIANSGSVEWDSASDGGSLIINGSVTGNAIAFNKKSVTINSEISLSGIFWDLIIPASAAVTNNNKIVVRRNFTIEDGGNYIHNSKQLILGTDSNSYPSDSTGTITDTNDTKVNLGNVLISGNSANVTKTVNTDILCINLIVDENTTFSSAKIITLTGNLTDNGSWTGNNTISFEGYSAQQMDNNAATSYNKISYSGTNSLSINNNLTVNTFENSGADSGAITFDGTVTIKNDVEFETEKTVQFADDVIIINGSTKKKLTHTAGKTVFANSELKQVNASRLTINSLEASDNLIINAEVEVDGSSAVFDVNQLVVTGVFTATSKLTLNNSGVFYIADGSNCIFIDEFVQTGTADVMLGGGLMVHENASFSKDLYIFGDASRTITADSDKKITVSGNLIFSMAAASTVTIGGDDNSLSANNIALYSGQITLNSSLTSIKDVVFLGPEYSVKDSFTGIDNEYIYNQLRPGQTATSTSKYQFNMEAYLYYPLFLNGNTLLTDRQLPDGSSTNKFGGKIIFSNGASINVGQNFYANGITLTSNSGNWNLNIKTNEDSLSCFAEAYFCTVKNSIVNCTTTGKTAMVAADECNDDGNNTNWLFDEFKILNAYTVRDDIIRIEFNYPIRNKHGEIVQIYQDETNTICCYLDGTKLVSYGNSYKEEELHNVYSLTEDIGVYDSVSGRYYIYLTTLPGKSWNTDATGTSAGDTASTDRKGNHKSAKPLIDVPRAVAGRNYLITNVYGKRLRHYHGTSGSYTQYTSTEDKTGPSLIEVHTGQECHTEYGGTSASQPDYDAHNFIEFRYSEAVEFNSNSISTGASNIPVSDSFGAITEDVGSNYNGPLTFAGLASVEKGNVYTKKGSSDNKYVNTLYRKDAYSIRISIAGLVEGTVSSGGKTFKNWTGYIENAILPNGTVSLSGDVNELVKDRKDNSQKKYYYWTGDTRNEDNYNTISVLNTYSSSHNNSDKTYGTWDIYAPEVARLHNQNNSSLASQYEVNGVGTGGKLESIEFHVFDNAANSGGFPVNASGTRAYWISTLGWCSTNTGLNAGGNISLISSNSYLADIFGGSRPFVSDSRTGGGLRYCTYYNRAAKFTYGIEIEGSPTVMKSAAAIKPGASSPVFQGASVNRNNINSNYDTQYITLSLQTSDSGYYDVEQSLEFAYDDEDSYITDLAGNRLRSAEQRGSIDRSPPDFDVIIAPIGTREMYILFYKQLRRGENSTGAILYGENGNQIDTISQSFEEIIPHCFEIGKLNGSNFVKNTGANLQVDTSVQAQFLSSQSNDEFTGIKITLNREVTLKDVQELYIRVIIPEDLGFDVSSKDIVTGMDNSQVTLIQDVERNYMKMYTAHALSDFAVNAIINEYAYDPTYQDEEGNLIESGLYEPESFAVHDWSASQTNYGTLRVKRPVTVIARPTEYLGGAALPSVKMFYSDSPSPGSASMQYNSDIRAKKRVWLPQAYTPISSTSNTNYNTLGGLWGTDDSGDSVLTFEFPESAYSAWNAGNQISFLYGLYDNTDSPLTIYHSLVMDSHANYFINSSTSSPLYAIRLENPSDPTSFDLWSFRVKGINLQRGGITIMNNVINPKKGEKTVIKLDLKEESRVNIIVMTLDGAVVTYLNRSTLSSGEHFFTWDGKNKNGSEVARGMYFIRFVGSGIDETRKVMVVK
ncbi:MAG: hypothetical protein K6E97_06105 [Treponema sp.]|nr:hypothetical protein [Treponema sp.]